MLNIEDVKNEFKNIFNLYVKRRGADKLLEYLENNDFLPLPLRRDFIWRKKEGCANIR